MEAENPMPVAQGRWTKKKIQEAFNRGGKVEEVVPNIKEKLIRKIKGQMEKESKYIIKSHFMKDISEMGHAMDTEEQLQAQEKSTKECLTKMQWTAKASTTGQRGESTKVATRRARGMAKVSSSGPTARYM